MFRVRDTQNNRWVTAEDVLVNPIGDVFSVKPAGLFKRGTKLVFESYYIVHRDTLLRDKNDIKIYEGDFVKITDTDNVSEATGLIVYASKLASFLLLEWETSQAYRIGGSLSEHMEVVGNIFDTPELAEEMEEYKDITFGGVENE